MGENDSLKTSKAIPSPFQCDEQSRSAVVQQTQRQRQSAALVAVIGSVVSEAFNTVLLNTVFDGHDKIRKIQSREGFVWKIMGNATTVLQKIAHVLREARYARVAEQWRDESLAVFDELGKQIAVVERGVVRALGIASRGVHLLGYTPDRLVWIQQRAMSKANDPGRWDTLMGGLVSATDTLGTALARETLEEAGLDLAQLTDLRRAGHFTMRMPASDDGDLGYVMERIDWFEAIVPEHVLPLNQDGEVQQFRRVSNKQLRSMLHNHEFTSEAALIFAMSGIIF
jgi:8-oxo-dGTP pyrophosphatase MutT (NUDIX family)